MKSGISENVRFLFPEGCLASTASAVGVKTEHHTERKVAVQPLLSMVGWVSGATWGVSNFLVTEDDLWTRFCLRILYSVLEALSLVPFFLCYVCSSVCVCVCVCVWGGDVI